MELYNLARYFPGFENTPPSSSFSYVVFPLIEKLYKNQYRPSPCPRAIAITTETTKMDHIDHTTNSPKNTTGTPGEALGVHQAHPTRDYKPDPAKSMKLSRARQALIDDVIALYSCEPTIERVKRYTPDCVYDDQFVYANDRCCPPLWPSPGIPTNRYSATRWPANGSPCRSCSRLRRTKDTRS
jgi:hypothetical protein